ncbi:MAG: hypothetical protein KDC92_05360 [Bacteroidetes bacterium]|nr:hypothetical protein [Bacteroidota bacterium]
MKRILVGISFFLFVVAAHAQTVQETFQLALTAQKTGNFKQAEALLKRVLFFDNENNLALKCHLMLADCAFQQGQNKHGFSALDKAYQVAHNPIQQDSILLVKAKKRITNQQFFMALQDLYTISQIDETEFGKQAQFSIAVCHYGTGDFNAFNQAMLQLRLNAVDSALIYSITKKLNRKVSSQRLKRAQIASFILPGMGQLISGAYVEAANSVVLLSGILVAYWFTIKEYGLAHGLVALAPWFTRYYIGGTENAVEMAQKRQLKLKEKYFKQVLEIASSYVD